MPATQFEKNRITAYLSDLNAKVDVDLVTCVVKGWCALKRRTPCTGEASVGKAELVVGNPELPLMIEVQDGIIFVSLIFRNAPGARCMLQDATYAKNVEEFLDAFLEDLEKIHGPLDGQQRSLFQDHYGHVGNDPRMGFEQGPYAQRKNRPWKTTLKKAGLAAKTGKDFSVRLRFGLIAGVSPQNVPNVKKLLQVYASS